MVKIPQAESQEQITGASPSLRVSEGLFQGGGAELKQTAKALKLMSDQLHKTNIFSEATRGETEARRRLSELEFESETEADFDGKTTQDRIAAIRSEVSESIKIPEARDSFAASFDRLSIASDFKIRRTLNKKSIINAKANWLDNIDELQGDANREQELDLKLEQGVQNLLLDPIQARDLKKKVLKDWQEEDIRDAIAEDSEVAKDLIINGDFGDLSASETSDWLDAADKKTARNKKVAEVALDTKWLVKGGEAINNLETISIQDLIELVANEEISPNLGSDLIAHKTDPESVQYETNKKVWNELLRDSVDINTDLRKFQEALGKGVANKKIQALEAADFSKDVLEFFQGAIDFKIKETRRNKAMASAYALFDSNFNLITGFAFRLGKEFNKRIKEESVKTEDMPGLANELIIEENRRKNETRPGYEKGDIINTPNGAVRVEGFDSDGEPLVKAVK